MRKTHEIIGDMRKTHEIIGDRILRRLQVAVSFILISIVRFDSISIIRFGPGTVYSCMIDVNFREIDRSTAVTASGSHRVGTYGLLGAGIRVRLADCRAQRWQRAAKDFLGAPADSIQRCKHVRPKQVRHAAD